MEKIIGLKELRENTQTYIKAVQKGQSFVVIRKAQPIFKLSPIEDDASWEEVIDFTRIRQGGVKLDELLARL